MMILRQRLLLVAGWLVAAAGAGIVASAAVSVAGGQVLDRPPRPLTAAEVAALPVVEVRQPEGNEPHASGGFESTTGPPTSGSVSDTERDDAVGSGRAAAPSPTDSARIVQVVSTEGGKASFGIADGRLVLLWATPQPGFVVTEPSGSDVEITVVFLAPEERWVIEAQLGEQGLEVFSRPDPLV